MNRAVIYTRFSPRPNEQAAKSESCEVQAAYCEQRAAKKGYALAATFSDKAVSGADHDRPNMWEAIRLLGKGDVLLVYHPDRIARDVYLMEIIRRAVKERGATIEAVTGDVEGSGPEIEMVRHVLSAIAEYLRKSSALKTKYAILDKQRRGQRMSRHPPYGWRVADGYSRENKLLMEPVPREHEAIERIRELRAGGMSVNAIAVKLSEEMPDAARAGRWNAKSVWRIVRRIAA
jgi:DNA invertase Pin-like site-specific DNA recombinase